MKQRHIDEKNKLKIKKIQVESNIKSLIYQVRIEVGKFTPDKVIVIITRTQRIGSMTFLYKNKVKQNKAQKCVQLCRNIKILLTS